MDHGQRVWKVTLARADKEQPGDNGAVSTTARARVRGEGRRAHVPGCSYDGGVEAPVAGQRDSDGDDAAHHAQSVVRKRLKSEAQGGSVQFGIAHVRLPSRSSTHHCYSVARDDGAHVQNSIVGHVGEDVDDGDKGHGNSNGQGKIPGKTRRRVTSDLGPWAP